MPDSPPCRQQLDAFLMNAESRQSLPVNAAEVWSDIIINIRFEEIINVLTNYLKKFILSKGESHTELLPHNKTISQAQEELNSVVRARLLVGILNDFNDGLGEQSLIDRIEAVIDEGDCLELSLNVFIARAFFELCFLFDIRSQVICEPFLGDVSECRFRHVARGCYFTHPFELGSPCIIERDGNGGQYSPSAFLTLVILSLKSRAAYQNANIEKEMVT